MILSFKKDEEKIIYLRSIFEKVYFKDIIDRNNLQKDIVLESFMICKADRYDVKGKKYISTPSKYHFNELISRGYNVDVGLVEHNMVSEDGEKIRKQLEVDFICNQGSKRYYIQSALHIGTKEKMEQEQKSLVRIDDSFKKIIGSIAKVWQNELGIVIIGLQEFLLNKDSLDL